MSGDDVRDELETFESLVQERLARSCWYEERGRLVCFYCDGIEDSTGYIQHRPNCWYERARQVVERLDAARQPVEAHIRFSCALNQGHRRTEG